MFALINIPIRHYLGVGILQLKSKKAKMLTNVLTKLQCCCIVLVITDKSINIYSAQSMQFVLIGGFGLFLELCECLGIC